MQGPGDQDVRTLREGGSSSPRRKLLREGEPHRVPLQVGVCFASSVKAEAEPFLQFNHLTIINQRALTLNLTLTDTSSPWPFPAARKTSWWTALRGSHSKGGFRQEGEGIRYLRKKKTKSSNASFIPINHKFSECSRNKRFRGRRTGFGPVGEPATSLILLLRNMLKARTKHFTAQGRV